MSYADFAAHAHTTNLATYAAYTSRSGRATDKAVERLRRSFPLSQAAVLERMLRERGQSVATVAALLEGGR